ncbi:MAG: DUF3662 domain-containing protein [Peptococcaceae bacterium]|nr:DUF3662 domain-containing protein [Peptococcaceae bacterium]
MNLLSKCEDVAEVIFTFLFKKNAESIQPVEVARELLRAMQRNKQISVTNVYVPNVYRVTLNPEDYRAITNFGHTFLKELSRHIYEEGTKQGFTFLTPPFIELAEEKNVASGKIKLEVGFDDQAVASWQPEKFERFAEENYVEKTSVMAQERGSVSRERGSVSRERGSVSRERELASEDKGGNRREGEEPSRNSHGNLEIDAYLEFVEGFHLGKIFHLDQDAIIVGRQNACDLALQDDEVSRQHLTVFREGMRWCIEDLGSTNGTYVNGVHIDKYILKPGDRVRVGQTTFVFQMPEYQGK